MLQRKFVYLEVKASISLVNTLTSRSAIETEVSYSSTFSNSNRIPLPLWRYSTLSGIIYFIHLGKARIISRSGLGGRGGL
jgi:hypothetical protein